MNSASSSAKPTASSNEAEGFNVVLIGFMGTGKSSVGEKVAAGLGFRFADTDALIETKAGMTIPKIFTEKGESEFRALETAVLQQLIGEQHLVIATGGGIVTVPENIPLLHQLGFVVLLSADEEVIFRRISANQNRPLLHTRNPRETISTLLAARNDLYKEASDLQIDTTELSEADIAFGICESARVQCRDDSGA
ncbi:MAG: shikimate kinase [Verrucomicrobiales bacterium]|jgi:shikimate kinase